MRSLRDRESMQRGSPDYPLDYYLIDRNHPRYEMPYHWHAETELLHVISGQFSMTIDEETFLLAAGDAVYIAPGRLHGGKPENCVYECIVFDMHQLMKTNAFCRPLMTDIESRQVDIFPVSPSMRMRCARWWSISSVPLPSGRRDGRSSRWDAFSAFLGRLTAWALTGCTTRRRTGSPGTC